MKFWICGWMVFCLVEIAVKIINYLTFPWYNGVVALPLYFTILLFYGLTAIVASIPVNIISRTLSRRPSFGWLKTRPFSTAVCQTTLMLLYGLHYMRLSPLLNSYPYFAAYIFSCILLFLVLYKFFKKKEKSGELLACFICISFLLDILLVGGLYIYEQYSLSKTTSLTYPLVSIVSVLMACCLLIWLYFTFFRTPLLKATMILKKQKILLSLFLAAGVTVVFCFLTFSDSNNNAGTDPDTKPNVIIITMDTTRYDHLSCYGYDKKTTPNLDRFAEEGLLFEKASSVSSWTLPAHASIFTGLYPSRHGVYPENNVKLDNRHITLAEILSLNGYKTAGFIGGYFCSSFFGIAQGFNYYDENLINVPAEIKSFSLSKFFHRLFKIKNDFFERKGLMGKRIAPQINHSALKWLKKNNQTPFFLFLNYFDPHHPYLPLDSAQIRTPMETKIKNDNYINWEYKLIRTILRGEHILQKKEKEFLISRYDAEIKQMDKGIGKLFQFLKDNELWDNTLIIVTADHGESFGEHGLMIHTPAIYEELVRVPLIVKYPLASNKTGRSTSRISLVDIMPEVLTVAGIKLPMQIQGVPFSQKNRSVIVERYKSNDWAWTAHPFGERSLRAFYDKEFKLIWSSNKKHELYNLQEDPFELHNLKDQMPNKVLEMEKKLNLYTDQPATEDEFQKKSYVLDRETEEALKALGYIQ